ncbi:hypothetical protein [Sutcliffiella horikoshii]|uniref:hypothetical protein n=1 Tax=Sutcliffiella horikoshii TaxID=79883 RepID=UPI0012FB128D|nr:hypothetical protein [Sutcliffiella horikoshii]
MKTSLSGKWREKGLHSIHEDVFIVENQSRMSSLVYLKEKCSHLENDSGDLPNN